MPVFALGRDEIQAITVYLMTLLDSRDRLRYLPLLAKRVAEDVPSEKRMLEEGQKETKRHEIGSPIEFRYDGRTLFDGLGCSLCHTIGITGGEVGPPLTYIARKRDAEDLERLLLDPERVLPGGKMPQLYLNDAQIKGLVHFLSRQR
jgi:cytochrome c2